MTSQLELDLDSGPESARARLRRGLAGLSRRTRQELVRCGEWASVLVPALLALQIAWLGLVPVLRDGTRLDQAEQTVRARETALLVESQTLERESLMLDDPIWCERVRKSRQNLEGAVLELTASRTDARADS